MNFSAGGLLSPMTLQIISGMARPMSPAQSPHDNNEYNYKRSIKLAANKLSRFN